MRVSTAESLPATASFAEFARLVGITRPYVTQLRKDDRLVVEGRRVRVAESIARIAATKDPSKAGVEARHAAAREAESEREHAAPANERIGSTYQASRAVRERYLAMEAKRAYEVAIGKLLPVDDVVSAATGAVTTLRSRLESMPSVLAPQLAATADEMEVSAVLAESFEHALTELARVFASMTQKGVSA